MPSTEKYELYQNMHGSKFNNHALAINIRLCAINHSIKTLDFHNFSLILNKISNISTKVLQHFSQPVGVSVLNSSCQMISKYITYSCRSKIENFKQFTVTFTTLWCFTLQWQKLPFNLILCFGIRKISLKFRSYRWDSN